MAIAESANKYSTRRNLGNARWREASRQRAKRAHFTKKLQVASLQSQAAAQSARTSSAPNATRPQSQATLVRRRVSMRFRTRRPKRAARSTALDGATKIARRLHRRFAFDRAAKAPQVALASVEILADTSSATYRRHVKMPSADFTIEEIERMLSSVRKVEHRLAAESATAASSSKSRRRFTSPTFCEREQATPKHTRATHNLIAAASRKRKLRSSLAMRDRPTDGGGALRSRSTSVTEAAASTIKLRASHGDRDKRADILALKRIIYIAHNFSYNAEVNIKYSMTILLIKKYRQTRARAK